MTDSEGAGAIDTAAVTTDEDPCLTMGVTLRAVKSGPTAVDLLWPDAPPASGYLLLRDDETSFGSPSALSCDLARAHLDNDAPESSALLFYRLDGLKEECASGL